MTLLEIIKGAAAKAETNTRDLSDYPISLNPHHIFSLLQSTPTALPQPLPHPPATLFPLDSQLTALTRRLSLKLSAPSSLTPARLLKSLKSFLHSYASHLRTPISALPDDPSAAISALSRYLPRPTLALIASACAAHSLWEPVDAVLRQGSLSGHSVPGLAGRLAAAGRSTSLCLLAKHVDDLLHADLLSILNYFLSPPSSAASAGIAAIRHDWERLALAAIDSAAAGDKLAKRAAVPLAAACDGFSAREVCLHYVLWGSGSEGVAMSAAVANLGGTEVRGLVKYLGKWLWKFESFPGLRTCPKAAWAPRSRWRECRWVPSMEAAVRCLGLVLDEHFSYLVLDPAFQEELLGIETVVISLEEDAGLCSSLSYVIEGLKSDANAITT